MPASNLGLENIDQLVRLTDRYIEDVTGRGGCLRPDIIRAGVVGDGNRLILGGIAVCVEEIDYQRAPQVPLKEITEDTYFHDIRILRVRAALCRASEDPKLASVTGEIQLTNKGDARSDFFGSVPSTGRELSSEESQISQVTSACIRMANAILVDEILADAAERADITGRALSGDPYRLLLAWSRYVELGACVSITGIPVVPKELPRYSSIVPMAIAA